MAGNKRNEIRMINFSLNIESYSNILFSGCKGFSVDLALILGKIRATSPVAQLVEQMAVRRSEGAEHPELLVK